MQISDSAFASELFWSFCGSGWKNMLKSSGTSPVQIPSSLIHFCLTLIGTHSDVFFHTLPMLFPLNFKSNRASYWYTGWRNTIHFFERLSCLKSDMLLEYIFYLWLSHKNSLSLKVIGHTELNESILFIYFYYYHYWGDLHFISCSCQLCWMYSTMRLNNPISEACFYRKLDCFALGGWWMRAGQWRSGRACASISFACRNIPSLS